MSTYLEDFMDKMYLVPNDVNRYLRLIRNLDKKVEQVQNSLIPSQTKFLSQLKQYKESTNGISNGNSAKKQSSSPTVQIPAFLRNEYDKIVNKQKEIYGYLKEKYDIAQQLRVMVNNYYEQLQTEQKKVKENNQVEKTPFDQRKKNAKHFHHTGLTAQSPNNATKITGTAINLSSINQFMYDLKEPKYCYCGGPSFGEMVECENRYCEKQWFHLECIEEKILPQKWYCLQCQKQKDKTRNPISRKFFLFQKIKEKNDKSS